MWASISAISRASNQKKNEVIPITTSWDIQERIFTLISVTYVVSCYLWRASKRVRWKFFILWQGSFPWWGRQPFHIHIEPGFEYSEGAFHKYSNPGSAGAFHEYSNPGAFHKYSNPGAFFKNDFGLKITFLRLTQIRMCSYPLAARLILGDFFDPPQAI